MFWKYYCFRTCPGLKGNCVPNGIPIGFEMAEKKKSTNTDIFVFIQVEIGTQWDKSCRDQIYRKLLFKKN